MPATNAAPAAGDVTYLNVYTLHHRTAESGAFVESGVFVECLGTCAMQDLVDALLQLPARAPRPDHFVIAQPHPGADFTTTTPSCETSPSHTNAVGHVGENFNAPPAAPPPE